MADLPDWQRLEAAAWNDEKCDAFGWRGNVIPLDRAPHLKWLTGSGFSNCAAPSLVTGAYRFQQAKGLTADGKIGPATLAALRSDLEADAPQRRPPPGQPPQGPGGTSTPPPVQAAAGAPWGLLLVAGAALWFLFGRGGR